MSAFGVIAAAQETQVVWVADGDTVKVAIGDQEIFVRLLGLDAAETIQSKALKRRAHEHGRDIYEEAAAGDVATAFARHILPKDCIINLEHDGAEAAKDRYGRLLAYIRLPDGTDFSATMLSMGMARAQRRYDYLRKVQYLGLEAQAKRESRGLWALKGP